MKRTRSCRIGSITIESNNRKITSYYSLDLYFGRSRKIKIKRCFRQSSLSIEVLQDSNSKYIIHTERYLKVFSSVLLFYWKEPVTLNFCFFSPFSAPSGLSTWVAPTIYIFRLNYPAMSNKRAIKLSPLSRDSWSQLSPTPHQAQFLSPFDFTYQCCPEINMTKRWKLI